MLTTRWLKFTMAAALTGLGIYAGTACLTAPPANAAPATADMAAAHDTVTISEQQAQHVTVVPVQQRDFEQRRDAVGYIDFDQEHVTQVFPPYQGRVRQVLAKVGDDVAKGQALFTLDSPDLAQAEASLIATAGQFALTSKTLARARQMLEAQANAQKDVEQAVSDQQAAEGSYHAARDVLRRLGMSDAAMDRLVASRKVDGELRIVSPYAGRVTARTIAPGDLIQPGSATAPFTVADLGRLWMVANVPESDAVAMQPGQPVTVSVNALPGRTLSGRVSYVGSAVDPVTHRIAVRSEIHDPQRQLRPQMLATFVIRTGDPVRSVGVPVDAVVREGDGTMTVFVTRDGRSFVRRPVKVGLQQDDMDQILDGLSAGEQVASDGALFLSNALAAQSE